MPRSFQPTTESLTLVDTRLHEMIEAFVMYTAMRLQYAQMLAKVENDPEKINTHQEGLAEARSEYLLSISDYKITYRLFRQAMTRLQRNKQL